MKLYEENFDEVKNGNKKREYRLNDEKENLLKLGIILNF